MKIHALIPVGPDFEMMVICAERYVIGRATYLPPDVISYIRYLIPMLTDNTLYVLSNDIRDEFARYERIQRNMEYGNEWKQLKNDIDKEREERK